MSEILPLSAREKSLPGQLGSVMREAVRTALPPWRTVAPTISYCLRTLAAIGIALYTAFWLQLLSPLSSVTTVLIVANPVTGALLSKSVWRLLGTLVGACAAILLMAGFAQSPLLFAIVFSLCIGVACIASTLLRFFKAYGAVLAGYTIIIVSAPAFADPEHVLESALSRVSAVSVGIASAALVFLLTNIRPPTRLSGAILALIHNAGAALAGHAVSPAAPGHTMTTDDPGEIAAGQLAWRRGSPVVPAPGEMSAPFYDRRGALLAQANGLTEIIEYAVADSYEVAQRANRLRLGAAGLTGALIALNPRGRRVALPPALADELHAAIEGLASLRLEAPEPVLDRIAALRDRLAAWFHSPPGRESQPVDLDILAAVGRSQDLLARLHRAVSRLATMPKRERTPLIRLRPYLDWPTALRNGARGVIVTMLAFLFWYVTQWPSGPTLLSYLVPASCLLATNPSASRASVDFSTGTLLAIPASYVCESLMLPQISGFPLLLAALGVCLLPGIWLQFHPRHGLRAFGYVVFFNAMITVRNPITFDDIGLINGWLAFIMGTAALMVVFRALLPPNPTQDANRLVHSITRAVARLGRARRPPILESWESLQMQKALRLIQRLQPMETRLRQEISDSAFIAIELGRDVLRLRLLLTDTLLEPPERQASNAALAAIGRLQRDPRAAASLAQQAADLLAARSDPAGKPPPSGLLHVAALLHEIAAQIDTVPEFLRRDYAVPRC
jgi:uncharacterized membrane protein YccC